jgi:hypothetical protein
MPPKARARRAASGRGVPHSAGCRQGARAAARPALPRLSPRAAVRPWPPEGVSAVLIPPLAAAVPSCWRRRRESQRRAAAGALRPPRNPRELGVTHVECGVLGTEEREGHRQGLQPRAAVVLLGGDGVAALRAERVKVGEGHCTAHSARPESQGRGQQQRPGSAARHRRGLRGTQRDAQPPRGSVR